MIFLNMEFMFDYTVAYPNHKTIFLNLEILFDYR